MEYLDIQIDAIKSINWKRGFRWGLLVGATFIIIIQLLVFLIIH